MDVAITLILYISHPNNFLKIGFLWINQFTTTTTTTGNALLSTSDVYNTDYIIDNIIRWVSIHSQSIINITGTQQCISRCMTITHATDYRQRFCEAKI